MPPAPSLVTVIPPSSFQVSLSTGPGDCLVCIYAFLARLHERGVPLPLPFPATICYEHHFPRAWFYFEADAPEAVRAHRLNALAASSSSNGSRGAGAGGDPAAAAAASGSGEVPPASLAKQLVQSRVLRQMMGLPRADDPNGGGEQSQMSRGGAGGTGNRVLMRRAAKDCGSTAIRAAFAPPGGPRRKHHIGCEVVTRDSATGNVAVQYLDSKALAAFLLNTPEQCILSRAVVNRRRSYDVIVATWTPSVFTVEHRVNVHRAGDAAVPVQQRGDTSATSLFTEVQVCPLLAARVREALQRLAWLLARHERLETHELRATLRQDAHMQLWLLWVDLLRAEPIHIARPITAQDVHNEHAREVARRTHSRRALQQHRGGGIGLESRERSERRTYGAWPSFIRNDEVSVELLMHVEDLLEDTLRRAHAGHNPATIRRANSVKTRQMLLRTKSGTAINSLTGDGQRIQRAQITALRGRGARGGGTWNGTWSPPHSPAPRHSASCAAAPMPPVAAPSDILVTGSIHPSATLPPPHLREWAPMVPLTLQLLAADRRQQEQREQEHEHASEVGWCGGASEGAPRVGRSDGEDPPEEGCALAVHFEVLPSYEYDPGALRVDDGCLAPPPSPRPLDGSVPLVETKPLGAPVLAGLCGDDHDAADDAALTEESHERNDTPCSLTLRSLAAHSDSGAWDATIVLDGPSARRGGARWERSESNREKHASFVLSHRSGGGSSSSSGGGGGGSGDVGDVVASIRQMKQRVIAARRPGPSGHHVQQLRRLRYSSNAGHLNDPFFGAIARDIQAGKVQSGAAPRRARLGLSPSTDARGHHGGRASGSGGGGPGGGSGGARGSEKTLRYSEFSRDVDGAAEQLGPAELALLREVRGLDVQQRLDYNAITAAHAAVLSGVDDVAYEVYSASLRQRASVPIPFDLPGGSPMPSMGALRALGFRDIEDCPSLAATSVEPLYCVPGELNLRHAFSGLKALVAACCRDIEREFLTNCRRTDVLDSGEASLEVPSGSRQSSPMHLTEDSRVSAA